MISNNYLNTIRLCIKANKFSFGETMLYDIRLHKAYVVVIALDAGATAAKKIKDKCNSFQVNCLTMLTKNELYDLFNKNISSFAITDENLAKKFLINLENKGDK